jgi:hypothetical protein
MGRIQIRDPGEFYADMLALEAYLKGGRSLGEEACNLLCARLMQRREIRGEMLQHLAMKRGVSADELIVTILKGEAKPISAEEFREIPAVEDEE